MATTITALLDQATLRTLLDQLTPLQIRLDEAAQDRFLWIDRPDVLEFAAGVGVRIRTRARLQWSLGGIAIPVNLPAATFVLEPWLSPPPHTGRLNFRLKLEAIELGPLPQLVQQQIVLRANQALGALGETLGWSFGQTLSVDLKLPAALGSVERFTLEAGVATVEVLTDALRMVLPLPMQFVAKRLD
jgi:hypothetical protein